jgi:NTE family protein
VNKRIYHSLAAAAAALIAVSSAGWSGGLGSERPKIGLALGGGGALGLAHIGVLKVFEEERVPVDYIAGTSMGSIIAGFYASGMSPQEIEDALVAMDWWDIMADATPRRQLEWRRKEDTGKYLLNIELGLRGKRVLMPSGIAAGQKFNNVMQSLTLPVAGIDDFNKLNIPFRCVATDLDTSKAVILDHGNLGTAMRASMAVPGMFTPVRFEGKVLVDGGVVDNIPVDVARDMGAEVLIAVDVGSEGTNIVKQDWQSMAEILAKTYAILQRPKEVERMKIANLVIAPDLTGCSASEFHRTKELIDKGYEAADRMREQIRKYSVSPEAYKKFLERQRRARVQDITVSEVRVSGLKLVDERMVRARIETKPGESLDFKKVNADLNRVYGMGYFETVTYFLQSTNDEHLLRYEAHEKPWGPGYVHFGLNLESDSANDATWSALLDYTRTPINRLGGEFRIDLQVGSKDMAYVELFQPLDYESRFILLPHVETSAELIGIYSNKSKIAEYDFSKTIGFLGAGIQFTRYGLAWVGYEGGHGEASTSTGASGLPGFDGGLGAIRCALQLDQLDDPVFARSGYMLNAQGRFARESLGEDADYDKASLNFRSFKSLGDHTLMFNFLAASALNSELPAYNPVLIGGASSYPGLSPYELRGQHGGVAGVGYRYRIAQLPPSVGKGVYVGVSGRGGNVWQEKEDIDLEDLIYGGSVVAGLDTVLGPIYLGYAMAEEGRHEYYFSLGSQF